MSTTLLDRESGHCNYVAGSSRGKCYVELVAQLCELFAQARIKRYSCSSSPPSCFARNLPWIADPLETLSWRRWSSGPLRS